MTKQNTIEIYSKYAEVFDAKIATLQNYNQTYVDFLELAKQKDSLLDLACGPGNISRYIKNLLPHISIVGVDLSKKMLDLAKQKLPSDSFYCSDILNVDVSQQTFDLVVCGFGLPYIQYADLPQFFAELSRFSHKDSCIYVSCMQGNETKIETTSFTGKDTLEIVYHTKESILDLIQKSGFELQKYSELNYTEPDGSISIDMVFIFLKL